MNEAERRAASEKYYQELRKQLDERIRKDKQLRRIAEKIANKTADLNDTASYSEIVSNHLAAVMQDNVGEITSPLAKEYVCKELLKDQHSAINEVLGEVQVSIDEKNGIHLRPQKAPFPMERVMTVAHALEDPTVSPETIKRRAGAPVANVSKSFHDDYIKKNAQFRHNAGLQCYIVRATNGKCCEWCGAIAGRYPYNVEDMPKDIFRRHDNCDCTTIFEEGRHRQDVWSKRTWEAPELGEGAPQPTVLSQEQANELEQRNLAQFKGLTNGGNGDIMESRGGGLLNISMQFFAEKDIEKQESASLLRSMRKYEQRIEEHKNYISNPSSHCPDWDSYSEQKKSGLIRHWKKEISNFEESIQNRIDELKKRGEYNE